MIAHRADVEWCSKNAELDINVFRSAHSWAGEIVLLRVILLNAHTKNANTCFVVPTCVARIDTTKIQLKYN